MSSFLPYVLILSLFAFPSRFILNAASAGPQADVASSKVFAAEEPKAAEGSELKEAVAQLKGHHLIDDPEFWLQNARPGKFIEMSKMRELVIATANKIQPAKTPEEALDVLQKKKALAGIDKLKDDLVNKDKIAGGVAGRLVGWLATALQ